MRGQHQAGGSATAGPAARPLPVFAAFAGGGAKGLVHVGALKALETKNVEIRGVSGTSAGAIVAALKAAGFTADDMVDPVARTTLLDALVRIDPSLATAPDLFGPGGWIKAKRLRRMLRLGFGRLLTWVAMAAGLLLLLSHLAAAMTHALVALVLWIGWMVGLVVVARWILAHLAGLSRLERFKGALDTLLSRKVFPGETGRTVRMKDFGTSGRPSLKIVGSNLSKRRLTLFSAETTPEIPVAEAVAASICIPIVFEPQRIRSEFFEPQGIGSEVLVDGGLVSNLPAWPFDEERNLDPDAITLAFEIADVPVLGEELGRTNWLPAAIRTALFGSGILNLRAVGRLEHIELQTDLGVLDFDLDKSAVLKQVAEARTAAELVLEWRLLTRPFLYQKACETMIAAVAQILDDTPVVERLERDKRRVRVSLAMPDEGHTRSLRLRYGAGYRDDLDERLLLPLEGSVVGRAWSQRKDCFVVAPIPEDIALPGPANRFRRRQVWRDMEWILAIPIFREEAELDAPPEFVVSIDCNERPTDASTEEFHDILWGLVVDSFDELLLELDEFGDIA